LVYEGTKEGEDKKSLRKSFDSPPSWLTKGGRGRSANRIGLFSQKVSPDVEMARKNGKREKKGGRKEKRSISNLATVGGNLWRKKGPRKEGEKRRGALDAEVDYQLLFYSPYFAQ